MAKEDNLKSYKKGQSGNPNGRPKGSKNRSTIARKWLGLITTAKNDITGEEEQLSQEDQITLALMKKAMTGDAIAYQKLMDSGYGAPVQQIEQDTTIRKTRKINWTK